MSFWGPSSAEKDAKGKLSAIPNWVYAQMQTADSQAAQSWLKANGYNDEFVSNLQKQIQNGIGTPGDIRATGRQVMPGVNDLIASRMFSQEQQQKNYNDVPGPQTTIDSMNSTLGDKSKRIGDNQSDIQGLLDTGFGTQLKRVGDTSEGIGSDLASTYGGAISDADKAFGDAAANTDKGFGAIGKDASTTYDQVRARINQSRDPQLGTVARSFAPAMAATLKRIRAAGIDPNSPEAASLLQAVDTARGHAFDDTMTQTLNSLNSTDLAQQANQQGLDLSKLSNDQQLALQAAANKQGLTLDQYMKRTDLATQTRDLQNNLTQGKMAADVTNKNAAFNQNQSLADQKLQQDLISRGLLVDDANNKNTLLDKQDASNLTDQDLKNQEFQAGLNFTGADNAVKTAANTQLGQAATQQFGVSGQQQAQALADAAAAEQQYGTAYGVESADSGWGKKLLGGTLAGVANAVLPGSGNGIAAASGLPAAPAAAAPGTAAAVNPWANIFGPKVSDIKGGSTAGLPGGALATVPQWGTSGWTF